LGFSLQQKFGQLSQKCRVLVNQREVDRHVIAAMHKNNPGASEMVLAKLANCSRGAVQRALAKLRKGVPLKDASRSERPRVLQGEALDRAIQIGVDMPVGSSRMCLISLPVRDCQQSLLVQCAGRSVERGSGMVLPKEAS